MDVVEETSSLLLCNCRYFQEFSSSVPGSCSLLQWSNNRMRWMISTDARCYSIKSLTVLDRIQLIRLLLLLSFSPRRLLLLAAFVLRWHLLLGWRGGWGWDDSKTSSLALLSSVFWGSARKSNLCFVGCKSRAADDSLSHRLHYLVVAAPHPLPTPPIPSPPKMDEEEEVFNAIPLCLTNLWQQCRYFDRYCNCK